MQWTLRCMAFAVATVLFFSGSSFAQEKKETSGTEKATSDKESTASDESIALADGKISIVRPKAWKRVPPKSNIVEHEFRVPEDGDEFVRITIMGAGGSLEQNIDRWIGQFDGAKKADAEIETKEVDNAKVTTVRLSGTFKESMGGPFAPSAGTKKREGYSLLGAILQVKDKNAGKDGPMTFVKITGPTKLVKELDEGFVTMLKDLKSK